MCHGLLSQWLLTAVGQAPTQLASAPAIARRTMFSSAIDLDLPLKIFVIRYFFIELILFIYSNII